MEDNQKKKTPLLVIIMAVLLVIALVVIAVLLLRQPEKEIVTVGPKIETQGEVVKNEHSISLPGYGSLTLKADATEQNVNIPNPPENTCLVRISLVLSDGTVLWVSEDVQPGYYSTPIVLPEPLKAGEYSATLKYDCFTDDGNHSALNGAESALTLRVK